MLGSKDDWLEVPKGPGEPGSDEEPLEELGRDIFMWLLQPA
jgi:hypothetical protein